MAVVSRGQNPATNTGNTTAGAAGGDNELTKISSLSLVQVDGGKVQLDYEEDAWASSAPPPAGRYRLKLFQDKEGWKMGLIDPKDKDSVFFTTGLECRIVDDNKDLNNIPVFANVTTRMYRGKSISTMVGLIIKAGFKPQQTMLSPKQQAQIFEIMLKKEPIVEAELDWKCGYKDPGQGARGGDWVNVYNHMDEFPEDEKDPNAPAGTPPTYQHIIRVSRKDGGFEEVRANLYVSHWYSKGEPSIERKKAAGANGQGLLMPLGTSTPGAGMPPPMLAPSPLLGQQPQPMQPVMGQPMMQQPQPVQQPVMQPGPMPMMTPPQQQMPQGLTPADAGDMSLLLDAT